MDKGAWRATVHRVTKSQMPLKQLCMHGCVLTSTNIKLVLENAEEPEIKLLTSTGSSQKQESSRNKHLFLVY